VDRVDAVWSGRWGSDPEPTAVYSFSVPFLLNVVLYCKASRSKVTPKVNPDMPLSIKQDSLTHLANPDLSGYLLFYDFPLG